MAITVSPDSLAADGVALADWQAVESPPECEPASAHSVSIAVATQLSAHSASLTASINHGQRVRTDGGVTTQHTAVSLRATDEANADLIAGNASVSGAVPVSSTPAAPAAPVSPEVPLFPPPSTSPGEAQAVALHTSLGAGHGSASMRALADHWQSVSATLDNVAAQTAQTAVSIDAHWSDGIQQAGANTATHGTWWSDASGRARGLASAANEAADHFDQAIAATPTPGDFADAHSRLAQAIAENTASHGLLSSKVHYAAALLAQLQSQATEALSVYYSASATTTGSISGTLAPAPAIATGDSPAASVTTSGNNTAGNKTDAATQGTAVGANPATTPATQGVTTPAMQGMAQTMLPAAAMLPMMAMMPMSALSGLSGLSGPTTSTRMASAYDDPDSATAGSGLLDDLGDTSLAEAGGGQAEAVGGMASTPPVASWSAPQAVSGPAATVGTTSEGVGTSPAAAYGGSGMTPYPPMMGAPGAGDGGAQRDMRLYPDRRVVWRTTPNTEAVFGELPRERRPRAKRPAQGEDIDER